MARTDPLTPTERLHAAFELYELGEDLLRQRYRREHPDMTEEAIEASVRAWRLRRPGAEHGDAEGEPIAWPRSR
ncbi:MAG: hypothetical protein R3B70_15080 [Polyangiaceae bacterium]